MNMIRLSGVAPYGDDLLYGLCDELGLLVWQDFAFANMDYPADDTEFVSSVEAEASDFLEPVGRHACLAVLCGGSEVEQQAAMLGVDPAVAPGPLFDDRAAGGDRGRRGGRALRPLDADGWRAADQAERRGRALLRRRRLPPPARRRASRGRSVRRGVPRLRTTFPATRPLREISADMPPIPHDAAWKRGVPRDGGAAWDFEDVRDHYLGQLYGVDPAALRAEDPDRYLTLSRVVTGGSWPRRSANGAGARRPALAA